VDRRDQSPRSTAGSEYSGSQHPRTWSSRSNKPVVRDTAEYGYNAGWNIRGDNVLWEFCGGSAGRDRHGSVERNDLLLILPRAEQRNDVEHHRAGDVLLLHNCIDPGEHHARANVLHAGSTRLPVWFIPASVRAADDADIHNSGHHDDTGVLLHESRLLLCAHELLHGPGGDCALGYVHQRCDPGHSGSGVYAHDVYGPE
jgi:hypothetical protein